MKSIVRPNCRRALQRTFSSGSWDTGPAGQILGKPVLVKIHADGVTGVGANPLHRAGAFLPDTPQSMVAAITEVFGPLMIGRELTEIETHQRGSDLAARRQPRLRAVLDIALHDALGKALKLPVHALIGGACQKEIALEWSVSLADDVGVDRSPKPSAPSTSSASRSCVCKAAGKKGWKQDVR